MPVATVSAGDCLTKRRGETVVNGSAGHITWEQAERAMKQGFLPHTISTDWTPQGRAGGVIDLPNVMSKFPLLGHVAQLMTRSRPSRCKSPFWRLDFWWPPWTVSGCSA